MKIIKNILAVAVVSLGIYFILLSNLFLLKTTEDDAVYNIYSVYHLDIARKNGTPPREYFNSDIWDNLKIICPSSRNWYGEFQFFNLAFYNILPNSDLLINAI